MIALRILFLVLVVLLIPLGSLFSQENNGEDFEIRRWDRLELVNGKVFEGDLVAENEFQITFRQKTSDDNSGIEFSMQRSEVKRLLLRNPPEAVYKLRLVGFDHLSFDSQRSLGLWCIDALLSKEAIFHLEEACRLKPAAEETYELLLPLYDQRREISGNVEYDDREIGTLLVAIRGDVSDPWLRKRAVDGLLSIGDSTGAILLLEEIAGIPGDGEEQISARARLAELLHANGDEDGARVWANKLRASGSADRFPGVVLIEARWLLGDRGSGIVEAGSLLEERIASLLEREAFVGEAYLILGSLRQIEGDLEASINEFKKAYQAGAVDAVAAVTFALAIARSGDSEKALELISAARGSDRVAVEWRLVEAYIQENIGNFEDALLLSEDILEREDASWQARFLALGNRSRINPKISIDAEVENLLLSHSDNDSAFAECALFLGDSALRKGDAAAARRWLEYALRAGADTPETWLRLALAQRGPGGSDIRAREALDNALAVAPDEPHLLNALAELQYRQGDLEGALEGFSRVISSYPRKLREEQQGSIPEALAFALSGRSKVARTLDEEVWVDAFERADGAQVLNNWIERETFGIDIGLVDEGIRFEGVQKFQPDGLTVVSRPLTTPRLSGIRATIRLKNFRDPMRVGLRIEDGSGTGLVLFRDRDGVIGYSLTGRGDPVVVRSDSTDQDLEEQNLVETTWPANDRLHSLEIRLGNGDKEDASLYFDGIRIARKIPFRMRRLKTLSAGVSTQAELDSAISLEIQKFEIFRRKSRSVSERQY